MNKVIYKTKFEILPTRKISADRENKLNLLEIDCFFSDSQIKLPEVDSLFVLNGNKYKVDGFKYSLSKEDDETIYETIIVLMDFLNRQTPDTGAKYKPYIDIYLNPTKKII
jgi:hypothetical protein